MKKLRSILIIVCIIFCLRPTTVLANQNDYTSDKITEISADPNRIGENSQTLNLSFTTDCPDHALFGQPFQPPTDNNWMASTSDNGTAGSILVFDNFINSGSINRICFWGINGYFSDNRWYVCYESPMEFQIRFFDDNNGFPETQVASFDISCVGNQTGLIYGGAFELYQYFADLAEPVEISEGWISIQGMDGNPECWFAWMSSLDGYDSSSLQWTGSSLNIVEVDRALCLQHQEFLCGDIDGNNVIDLYDVIYFIFYKYKGGPAPASMLTTDINRDDYYNILDIVFLLSFLYKDGPTPVCP